MQALAISTLNRWNGVASQSPYPNTWQISSERGPRWWFNFTTLKDLDPREFGLPVLWSTISWLASNLTRHSPLLNQIIALQQQHTTPQQRQRRRRRRRWRQRQRLLARHGAQLSANSLHKKERWATEAVAMNCLSLLQDVYQRHKRL